MTNHFQNDNITELERQNKGFDTLLAEFTQTTHLKKLSATLKDSVLRTR